MGLAAGFALAEAGAGVGAAAGAAACGVVFPLLRTHKLTHAMHSQQSWESGQCIRCGTLGFVLGEFTPQTLTLPLELLLLLHNMLTHTQARKSQNATG